MTTYVKFTAEEIIGCLEDTLTAPKDIFEKALYYNAFVQASKEITDYFRNLYNETIQSIRFENPESDVYEIVEKFNENKVVDKAKLKAELPDVYNEIVHFKGSDVVRLVPRKEIYNAVINNVGAERAAVFEQVNVEDYKHAVPALIQADYLKEDGRSKGFFVEVKESVNLV